MKKIKYVLFLLALCIVAVSYGQQQRVSLSLSNVTVKTALEELKTQSGIDYWINTNDVDLQKIISVNIKSKPVDEALKIILQGQNVHYEMRDNHIVVSKSTQENSAQQSGIGTKSISGRVTDEKGEPLPGVSIVIKGTNIGTISDADGNYAFTQAPSNAILSFSFLGMSNKEITVGNQSVVNTTMSELLTGLDEVVVIGYGSAKKANLTGAVATVNMLNTLDKPATSLTNTLQGAVPGMAVIARPNDVGSDIGTINIRGRGNLGTSEPMYVVDGVPVSAGDFARIAPADIASISVLKDASSAAIYGSRAAYGVILVTTKSGEASDKANISFNAYYGSQRAIYLPSYVNAVQYAGLANQAAVNAGKSPLYNDEQLAIIANGSNPDLFPDNNWYDLIFRPSAPLTDYQLSISGGGKTHYYLSGGYMDQASLLPTKDLKRYSLRSNVSSQIGNIFKISANLSFIRDALTNDKGVVSFVNVNRMLPLTVNRQSNGNWGSITAGQIDATHAWNNPVRLMDDGGWNTSFTNRVLGTIAGNLTPMKGLDITGSISYNSLNTKADNFLNQIDPITNFFTGQPISGTGQISSLTSTWTNASTFLSQLYGSYEKKISEHNGKIMIGASYEDDLDASISAYRDNFPNNNLSVINAGAIDENITNTGAQKERTFISYFGRFNYSFMDRYLFELNFRADGSSQFQPGNRWGYFPSVSGAWRISEESFMKNAAWINNLKLRVSWGKLGNVNNVGYYNYTTLTPQPVGVLGNSITNGILPTSLVDPNLTWETVVMSNVGLDANLFSNKFSMQIDAFNKTTENILLNLPVPLETGFQTMPSNAAKVSNKGIELNLSYRNNINKFNYEIYGNMTKIWNKVLDMGGQNYSINDPWIYQVGSPIGSFYMLKAQGLFIDANDISNWVTQQTRVYPGSIKYANINDDDKIDGNDRTIVGNDVPYFNYGLGINLEYGGFDFSLQGQGVANVKVYLDGEASQAFFNGANVPAYVMQGWTADNPNPNAPYPRLLFTADDPQANIKSSFWLFDASYFRFKTMTLGYTIPKNITMKWHIQSLRFFVSSNNAFTIRADKRLKFDPEYPTSRGNYYPSVRTVSFGLNVNL